MGGGDERAMLLVRCHAPSMNAWCLGAIWNLAEPNALYESDGGRMSITLAKSKRHWPFVLGFNVGNEKGAAHVGNPGLRVVPGRPVTAGRNTLPGKLFPEVRS